MEELFVTIGSLEHYESKEILFHRGGYDITHI